MANEGIEVEVYSYEDPTEKVGSIFGRQEPQSLDELNGVGGGQFNIARNDPHIAKKPELLDDRNVCKVKVNGTVAQAFLIRDINDIPVAKGGGTYREIKGPGLKEWFDDADVYPFQPLKSFSPVTRFFNFASEASTWYSKYNWINPTELGRVRDKSLIWGAAPDKWPGGAEGAKWIWVEPYEAEASIVPCYFRYTVTLATSGNYAIYSAVDDHYELYVDGEFIAKSSDKSSSHVEATRVVVKLGAGTHVIAYKAKNFPTDAETPDSPAALAMAMFKVAKGGKETLIGQSGGSGWKCLAYPAEAPGWTPGEVLLALINEAEARGVRSMGWINPTFTADLDSYNNAWASRREWSWAVGTSYADIITELEDTYDIWVDPNNFNLNIVPDRGAVRSAPIGQTPPVQFMLGKHVIDGNVQSRSKIKNNLLVQTDDGWIERTAGSSSTNKYGRVEGSLAVPGGKANAIPIAQAIFAQRAQPEEGASYELLMDTWVPIVDFNIGDWVLAPDRFGNPTPRRIMSLSVAEDKAGNPVWTIEFDTIFRDNEERLNRIITQLGGGGASSSAGSARPIGGGGGGGNGDPGSRGDAGVWWPPSTPGYDIQDEVPPPQPSGPIATARAGVVSVQWDGKDFNGLEMPYDFDHVEVMTGALPGVSVGTLQAGLGNNTHHITGLPYNQPVTVRFVAVDVAGNKSDPSVSVTLSTTPIVDTDLIGRIIADTNIKLGAIKTELIADQAILTGKLADNAVSLAKLDSITRETIEDAGANATLANGRLTTSTAVPTAANGVGKPTGAIWYRYNSGGTLLSTWRWNGTAWDQQSWGQDAIAAGAIVNDKLANLSITAVKIADNAIEAGKIAANAVTAREILAGTITAASGIIANAAIGTAQIADLAVTNAKVGNIDAGKVTTGFLDAARIQTNSILANKIGIGDFTNYASGSDFEDPALNPWGVVPGVNYITSQIAYTGTYSFLLKGNGNANSYLNTQIPAKPGDTFYVEFWMRRSSLWDGLPSNSKLRFGSGSWLAALSYAAVDAPANVWTKRSLMFTVPTSTATTGMYQMSAMLVNQDSTAGDCYLDDIVIRKVFGGELLVDGAIIARNLATDSVTSDKVFARAITTTKIATNAVTANEIAALTITANEIAANAITAAKIAALQIQAGHIAANAITADKIDAGAITAIKIDTDAITATKIAATAITSKHTITGARFRTTATANRGIDITSLGLIAYNSSGTPTVVIDAGTGDATFIGTIRNRPSGPRVAINSSDTTATIYFYGSSEGGNILPAQISSDPNGQSLFLFGGNPSSTTPIFTVLRLNERTSAISWLLGRSGYDGAAAYPRIRGDEDTTSFWERSTGHRVTLSATGYTQVVGNGLQIFGTLSTTGAKQFQMDHPVKEGKTLTHASTESPHNGVEYWSDGLVDMPAQGFKTITLPAYFEALTAADHRIALVTPGSEDANLWVEAIQDGKLIVHGTPGAKFSWLVKARRTKLNSDGVDELHFNVEQDKVEPMVPSDPTLTTP